MSWPHNAYCPSCNGITDWYAPYAPERIRCKCLFDVDGCDDERADLEPKERPDGRWQVAA